MREDEVYNILLGAIDRIEQRNIRIKELCHFNSLDFKDIDDVFNSEKACYDILNAKQENVLLKKELKKVQDKNGLLFAEIEALREFIEYKEL